jgi:hypothetical protein
MRKSEKEGMCGRGNISIRGHTRERDRETEK